MKGGRVRRFESKSVLTATAQSDHTRVPSRCTWRYPDKLTTRGQSSSRRSYVRCHAEAPEGRRLPTTLTMPTGEMAMLGCGCHQLRAHGLECPESTAAPAAEVRRPATRPRSRP